MVELLPVIAAHAAIFLVAGAPIALSLRTLGGTTGVGWLLADALGLGLVLTTLAVVLQIWVGPVGVIMVGLFWLAGLANVIVGALRARNSQRQRDALVSGWLPRGRQWLLVGAWTLVLTGALLLRLRMSNFLPWAGDMGAYVNWANEYVNFGEFMASWPPFFPAFLAIGSGLFGSAFTTAAMPLVGILLVLAVARLARQLGAGSWATLLTAALVTLSVHAIWFSSFPASEALNAPIFVIWVGSLLGVLRSDRTRLPWWLASNGMLLLALGLLRGTGPLLLLPLLLLAVAVLVVPDWRALALRVWLAFGASLGGALISYWYGIEQIPRYYVDTQIQDLVPGAVFRVIESAGLFEPTATTAILIVLASAVLCGAGLFLAQRRIRVGSSRLPFVLGLVAGGANLFCIVFIAAAHNEIWHILVRAGLWLSITAVVITLLVGRVALPIEVSTLILFLAALTTMFLAIQTYRLRRVSGHSFYLYWDRYIFGELIPVFFVLLALALTLLWRGTVGHRARALLESPKLGLRALPALVIAALFAAAVLPSVPALRLVTQHAYMEGAYGFEQRIVALLPKDGTPIAWGATSQTQLTGFFFPNTWLPFAKPIKRSFGYDLINLDGRESDFAPDQVFTADMLLAEAACAHSNRLVLLETAAGGASLDERMRTDGIEVMPLGSVTSALQLLSQPPDGGWTTAKITVRAWDVRLDAALVEARGCEE